MSVAWPTGVQLLVFFCSSVPVVLNDHLFGKELSIRFSASAFRKLPSIYVFSYFPFGFEGRMWDLIVSVPDHCLSFYFSMLFAIHIFLESYNCPTATPVYL